MTDKEKPAAIDLLAQYIKDNGIKKGWFADQIGISIVTLWRIMNGEQVPRRETRKQIDIKTNGFVPKGSWE